MVLSAFIELSLIFLELETRLVGRGLFFLGGGVVGDNPWKQEWGNEGNEMGKKQKLISIVYIGHWFGQQGLDLAKTSKKHVKWHPKLFWTTTRGWGIYPLTFTSHWLKVLSSALLGCPCTCAKGAPKDWGRPQGKKQGHKQYLTWTWSMWVQIIHQSCGQGDVTKASKETAMWIILCNPHNALLYHYHPHSLMKILRLKKLI